MNGWVLLIALSALHWSARSHAFSVPQSPISTTSQRPSPVGLRRTTTQNVKRYMKDDSLVEDTSVDDSLENLSAADGVGSVEVNGSSSASWKEESKVKASKKEMLGFALPALGIYLSNPLLSNIDNAFVGQTVGTAGLAALSPATICTDQMLYLFSFLSRATTSIVSRAYSVRDGKGNEEAARDAASARKSDYE